jgi:hypothetical protein
MAGVDDEMTPEEAEQALADRDVVACVEAPLRDARALMEACLSEGVPALLSRQACDKPSCSPKFQVLVQREDAPRVAGLLQQRWLESIEREGLVAVPQALRAAPEEDELPCPACGTAAALVDGACSDCGLQLE